MGTRGEPAPYYCHPDERDHFSNADLLAVMQKYSCDHMPGLANEHSIVEGCMYTVSVFYKTMCAVTQDIVLRACICVQ